MPLDDFNDTFRDYYRGRIGQDDLRVEIVVGSECPVKLSLALPNGASLKHALATHPPGAILALDMSAETAAHLFSELRKKFDEMGWPLPAESRSQDAVQQRVPQNPRRSLRDKREW
jgi:hypothetical protein